MKKILPILISLFLSIAVIVPYSYSGNASKQFFSISSEEVNAGETLEMTLNLNKIEYNKFECTLSTDLIIEDIYENEDEVDLEIADGELKININKEELGIEQITLYYTIPEDVEADTIYTIAVTVTNQENEEEQIASTVSVKVVDNNEENNKEDEQKDNNKDNENKDNNKQEEDSAKNNGREENNFEEINQMGNNTDKLRNDGAMVSKVSEEDSSSSKNGNLSQKNSVTSSGGQSKADLQETVTYNGSDNNYLSSLVVNGYELNKTFNKESTTYFVTVDSSATTISIEATAEDNNATVCVSGADNLKTGTNKVLISVTSESGAVRTYRIYVIKK